MELRDNVLLSNHTTLGIGGPARWFAEVASEEDVRAAVALAQERGVSYFILGGGSNLLVSDAGFPGLVLQMRITGIEQESAADGSVLLRVGAGESWDGLVQYAVDHGLAGVECLAGIPGTVGGTPVQNVGAYGQEVAETIVSVRCYDTQTGTFVDLSNADCGFAYRTSVLNTTQRGRYIVVRVDFLLKHGGAAKLVYADLRKHFGPEASPTLPEVAEAVRSIRRGKGMVFDPDDPNSRSAGSFFRNPIVPEVLLLRVSEASGMAVDAVPHWPAGDGLIKLPAAWLLERAGFVKGFALGKAGISARHTLALVNRGGATAADIQGLRDRIIADVTAKFGIMLEQEPVSVG
jgi:UDP-N-acetylmuramate dehydrogenase